MGTAEYDSVAVLMAVVVVVFGALRALLDGGFGRRPSLSRSVETGCGILGLGALMVVLLYASPAVRTVGYVVLAVLLAGPTLYRVARWLRHRGTTAQAQAAPYAESLHGAAVRRASQAKRR